jgi:hypothetical protein
MKVIACLLLAIFISSVLFGTCNGAVWFEGYNPQEPQELQLNMQPINNITSASLPYCTLVLNETKSQQVNLTITVSTAALFYQTGNFETWLSIDSQESQKLVGLFHESGSAAGELYNRQYNITLRGLENGAHYLKVRVAGDYYGPNPEGGNYNCEGNATILIGDKTLTSPTSTTQAEPLLNPIIITAALLLIATSVGLLFFNLRHKQQKRSQ